MKVKNEENTSLVSTGELSKQLGVSVRTIRYYDQIGLVKPSKVVAGGKRYYSSENILDLQKILLLKSLKLSLDDSRRILAEQPMSAILLAHKSLLNEKVEQLNSSLNHTQSLLNLLDLKESLQWKDLISLVAASEKERDWNQYFTIEQQSILRSRLPKLESGEVTTKKWLNIIKRVEHCLERNISPLSSEGKLILEDMDILSKETFGDNPELMNTFWEVRKSAKASETLGLYPISSDVIDFLDEAVKFSS